MQQYGTVIIPGKSFEDAVLLAENKEIDTLVVLENDLYRRANEDSVNELFKKSRQVIVLDHLINKTTQKADILLPAATFAESEGTIVNNEGRAQRFYKALESKESGKGKLAVDRRFYKSQGYKSFSFMEPF